MIMLNAPISMTAKTNAAQKSKKHRKNPLKWARNDGFTRRNWENAPH